METERCSHWHDTLTAHFDSSSLRIVHQLRGPLRWAEEPAHISTSNMQTRRCSCLFGVSASSPVFKLTVSEPRYLNKVHLGVDPFEG